MICVSSFVMQVLRWTSCYLLATSVSEFRDFLCEFRLAVRQVGLDRNEFMGINFS